MPRFIRIVQNALKYMAQSVPPSVGFFMTIGKRYNIFMLLQRIRIKPCLFAKLGMGTWSMKAFFCFVLRIREIAHIM